MADGEENIWETFTSTKIGSIPLPAIAVVGILGGAYLIVKHRRAADAAAAAAQQQQGNGAGDLATYQPAQLLPYVGGDSFINITNPITPPPTTPAPPPPTTAPAPPPAMKSVYVHEGQHLDQFGDYQTLLGLNPGLTWPRITNANARGYQSPTNNQGPWTTVFGANQWINVPATAMPLPH